MQQCLAIFLGPLLIAQHNVLQVSGETFGPVTVEVGGSLADGSSASSEVPYWSEAVCYRPVTNLRPGDALKFTYGGHDVWRMASEDHLENCDFSDAVRLAGVGESPFEYVLTETDAQRSAEEEGVHFSCSVGAHCSSGQRLTVTVDSPLAVEGIEDRESLVGGLPRSEFVVGVSADDCVNFQSGGQVESDAFREANAALSRCTDPVLGDDGRMHVSCLSGPATMSPGGVINSWRTMHYPYPTDRRVVVGERTWEFVSGNLVEGTLEGVEPVPVNQLYVHHLSGRVVLGQGTEGVRRSEPDAPFPIPYGALTGDEGDKMIFHIIDLRGVDEWLECVECRCRDPDDGTYLNVGSADETGGVSCCTNCTSTLDPLENVDYRMRYNVSYSEVPEESPITVVQMLTTDISPAVGKSIEYDVPSFEYLPADQRKDGFIQRLERTGKFRDMFQKEFFGDAYDGPDTVRLLRCVAHMHIAAIGMWLQDAETGEMLCNGVGTHGDDPEEDKGFLTAIHVDSYEPDEKVFDADREVTLVAEYNATEVHTGVMGMYFIFVSSDEQVRSSDASLEVPMCKDEVCDVSLLPAPMAADALMAPACSDLLADSPACKFGGVCLCEDFVSDPASTGCGGVFSSQMGDIEVNSMCALHCDACPKTCKDELPDSPVCSFGSLCSCEEFVSHPDSTGCGGVFSSDWGDVEVNSMCAAHCDACPDTVGADVIQEEILENLEEDLSSMCKYATADCERMLTNLYTCSKGYKKRIGVLDANVDAVVKKHGDRLALKHSKLGSPTLWRNAEASTDVAPCIGVAVEEDDEIVDVPAFFAQEGSSNLNTGVLFMGILVAVAVVGFAVLTVQKIRREREAQIDETTKNVAIDETTLSGTGHEASFSINSPNGSDSSV